MDKRSIGIFLIMKNLREFKIDSFYDRLFLQKSIYLLQLLGVDFRFRFDWYIRGPYSKDLTAIAYGIDSRRDEYFKTSKYLKLRNDVIAVLERLKKAINDKPSSLDDAKWLELLSSIHYLKHISSTNPDDIKTNNIKARLEKAGKTDFDNDQIESAWEKLDLLGLIKNKSLDRIPSKSNE